MKLFNGKKFATPKPEKLLQRIIHIATKKGDLVLDYHLGSGTTCAVAHKMGRQYIGIEQMDYIEDIAVKRMQKVIGETVKKDGDKCSNNISGFGVAKIRLSNNCTISFVPTEEFPFSNIKLLVFLPYIHQKRRYSP
jgi:hypothetical protein